jgi:alkanesulfonate monooxygenase SsuD/methylene tetrahydromethanopterin reductase-like flavin-dependent oxidoreductase (luciferase family)
LCSAQAHRDDLPTEMGQGFRDYLDFNVEAEALGFHSSFLVEHHFTGWNQVSATLMLLSCLAMRTSRLRLGSAVMVLPWHNPVLLAEQAATLDLVSGGRLDLGIGKGYRHTEFAGFGIEPDEADARFDEAVRVMARSWSSRSRFSHHGRYWHFENIVVEPPPSQRPHPPLWVAAASADSIRRAASRGFNLILDQYATPDDIAARIALYRDESVASGRPFHPDHVAVARQVYVATDEADRTTALGRLAEYTKRTVAVSRPPDADGGSHVLAYAGQPGGTEQHALYGTPDAIRRGLTELQAAGATYVLVHLGGGPDQLRKFARHVVGGFALPQPTPGAT